MGLDMYLNKFPRYKKVTADQICAIENYFDWVKYKTEENYDGSFEKWCGLKLEDLPSLEVIEFYRQFYEKRYSLFDTAHNYGYMQIHEQVGYWRKANAIHNWFVDHVQDGEDDCNYHQEVTKGVLEDLLDTCEKVIAGSELVSGQVQRGYVYINGKETPNMMEGKYIKDTSVAEELLPTTGGFFFGSTEYDEYYVQDIQDTIDIITKVLETTDFEKEMLYYVSSW